MSEAAVKLPPKYQVQITHYGSHKSFRYFETLEEAQDYTHPVEYDFMGYPRKHPRITIKEFVGGKPFAWKYKKVKP